MAPNVLVPVIMAPLVVFAIYRRVRRNFGRQPVRPRRTWTRVGLFVALTVMVGLGGLRNPELAEGLAGGLLGGVALGLAGLKRTRFDITPKGDFYTPDPWIGLALTALLLGRLVYRFMAVYPLTQAATHAATVGHDAGFAAYQRSPLTMAVFGLLFGYYIAYYAGVLIHHRRVLASQPATPEVP